jgi:uncharacterized DUF497 family protein
MSKTIVSEDGLFEWDEEKSRTNKEKHGLSFDKAIKVFDDEYLIETYDEKHSLFGEDRYLVLGEVGGIVILFVCYAERNSRKRIITARKAVEKERNKYYEKKFNHPPRLDY